LTLIYSIFQFNHTVWPIWEKNNELEKTLAELNNRRIELEGVKAELNIAINARDDYRSQLLVLSNQNENIQKEIEKKGNIIRDVTLENNALKMVLDDDYDIYRELIYSYYENARSEIINEYTMETIMFQKTFFVKDRIISYCEKKMEERNISETKRYILEYLEKEANSLTNDDDFRGMLNFFAEFYIKLVTGNN
jgi:hypothetical protein